jgi:hypothetical protein
VPATVWIIDIGAPAVSARAGRRAPIVERIVTAFAPPGGAVAFLAWPATSDTRAEKDAGPAAPDPAGSHDALVIDTSTGAALVTAARDSGYTARELISPATAGTTGSPSTDAATGEATRSIGQLTEHVRPSSLDLIVTSTGPGDIDEPSADRVALLAARALRAGGILAVLTHSHQHEGELRDRTGTVVTAGQNADLLYLQHLVAVHGPVTGTDTAGPGGRGRHRRVHDDLLVLVQPRDHALDLANEAAA